MQFNTIKFRLIWAIWISICFTLVFLLSLSWPKNDSAELSVYDESASGLAQVVTALTIAKEKDERILLVFGTNWCSWCHKLYTLFTSDPIVRNKLKSNYVVVFIDVNEEHNLDIDMKYDQPTRLGLPVIVVLDKVGGLLTTKNCSQLTKSDNYDTDKIMDFLQEWSLKNK